MLQSLHHLKSNLNRFSLVHILKQQRKHFPWKRKILGSVPVASSFLAAALPHTKPPAMLALTFLAGSSGFTGAGPALVAPRPQVQCAGRPLLAVEMSAARRAHLGALVSGLTSLATLGAAANAAEIRSTPWAMSTFRACAALRIRLAAPQPWWCPHDYGRKSDLSPASRFTLATLSAHPPRARVPCVLSRRD